MARRLEPDARTLVFIDGQNVDKTCARLYRRGACHLLLLAVDAPKQIRQHFP